MKMLDVESEVLDLYDNFIYVVYFKNDIPYSKIRIEYKQSNYVVLYGYYLKNIDFVSYKLLLIVSDIELSNAINNSYNNAIQDKLYLLNDNQTLLEQIDILESNGYNINEYNFFEHIPSGDHLFKLRYSTLVDFVYLKIDKINKEFNLLTMRCCVFSEFIKKAYENKYDR